MPTIFRYDGFRFFFYSNESDPREPMQVAKAGAKAKFWLRPDVEVAANTGFDARDLRRISSMVAEHVDVIERAWNAYFG